MRASLATFAAAALAVANAQNITVSFDAGKPKHVLADKRFLCYNIDTGSIYNGFDFTNKKLQHMVTQLGPTVVRIGGTAADYSWYLPDDPRRGDGDAHTIINDATWDSILQFIANTNTVLLWDFNALSFRDANNNWDPTWNATAFLARTQQVKPQGVEIWWSIGNEPDLWPKVKVDGAQLAKDALTLKQTLASYDVGTVVYGPSFAGINTKDGAVYMQNTVGQVDGLTVHNYPLARHCTVPDYLNRAYIDSMYSNLAQLAADKATYKADGLVLELEETGGSYGGGCDNITDRYVSGFWYLHALGVVAEAGFDRVSRQDIAGWSFTGGMSHYQLIGQPGWVNNSALLTPHPDYFTSVLFKMLVAGTAILDVTVTGTNPGITANVSMHVWCGSYTAGGDGSVVLMYVNPVGSDLSIDFGSQLSTANRVEYILTSSSSEYASFSARVESGSLRSDAEGVFDPPASIQDDAVYLNGVQMSVDAGGALPDWPIPGRTGKGALVAPAYSYGFIAFPAANVGICTA